VLRRGLRRARLRRWRGLETVVRRLVDGEVDARLDIPFHQRLQRLPAIIRHGPIHRRSRAFMREEARLQRDQI
jgi:hypothetical protein